MCARIAKWGLQSDRVGWGCSGGLLWSPCKAIFVLVGAEIVCANTK